MTQNAGVAMNTLQPPDAHAFIYGAVDQAAIRDYVNLTEPAEIARLAAAMAPRPEAFDADALVDSAIALGLAAEAGLIRRREAMAAGMNFSTLLALNNQLGCSDRLYAHESDECCSDPVKGPALRFFQNFWTAVSIATETKDTERIHRALEAADGRTKLPRPELPCDLEPALRYAANTPDAPWPVLELAFKDFIGLDRIKREAAQRQEYHRDMEGQLDRDTAALAKLKIKTTCDPQRHLSQRKLEEKIKTAQDNLAAWRKVECYRESFTPGCQAPTAVAEKTEIFYAEYCQHPGCVFMESALAFFASEFRSFWQTYGGAYLRLHEEVGKRMKSVTETNRRSGAKGALARDHKKWIEHTTAFIRHLGGDSERKKPGAIQNSVATYVERHSGLKDKKALAKLKDFLGTLGNPAARQWNAATARQTLQNCGIKACSEDTIHECLKLLNAALKQGREKK